MYSVNTVIYSGDLEVIKEQNANLQIHVLHLQEEINVTQGKIKKIRDVRFNTLKSLKLNFFFLDD
jgi:hypothetical protein